MDCLLHSPRPRNLWVAMFATASPFLMVTSPSTTQGEGGLAPLQGPPPPPSRPPDQQAAVEPGWTTGIQHPGDRTFFYYRQDTFMIRNLLHSPWQNSWLHGHGASVFSLAFWVVLKQNRIVHRSMQRQIFAISKSRVELSRAFWVKYTQIQQSQGSPKVTRIGKGQKITLKTSAETKYPYIS